MQAPVHPAEIERLQTLVDYNVLDTPAETDFDEIVALASRICETQVSLVSLVDESRQWFKASHGTSLCESPRENAICDHALAHDDILEINDTLTDPRTADNTLIVTEHGMRFYAGVPLRAPNGLAIGTLCVLDNKPRVLTDLQRQTLRTLANQVMTQLELRRTLRNQDILRSEMDHRVKNSLQTVQSLIRLYSGKITDPAALTAFAAIERRLTAIVALHRELHQSSNIAMVNMKPFLDGVLSHLAATCPDNITIRPDVANFQLASTEATALAVVASECVANAIKHAFPDQRTGEIAISLGFQPDGHVKLTCRDNGTGSNHDHVAPDPMESLGLRIMAASAQQIAATIDRKSTPDGYIVEMTFKPVQG